MTRRVPSLGRRAALAGGFGALLAPAARAVPIPIPPADAFVDSVGVNIHLSSPPYAPGYARFRPLIGASGIRHLRDELRPGDDLTRWRDLNAAFGIRHTLLVSPTTNTPQQMLDYLAALGPAQVAAIEGQNEGDSDWFMAQPAATGGWGPAVVAYQRDIAAALRARYPSLPLLSPSVIDWKPADVALIAPAAAFCDIVALHAYVQHGQEPETPDDYAALSWYLQHMRDPFKPGAPVMVTETGYHNVVRPGGSGVSEAAAAIYLPRLLLNNFAAGVLRTFLYQFMDGTSDLLDSEQHWGLVRPDFTPKPAYHAIRRMLAAFTRRAAQDGPAVTASLPDPPADVRALPFRSSDGALLVALWRTARSWDVVRAADRQASPRPVLIVPDRAVSSAEQLVPNDGDDWQTLAIPPEGITVPVGAKLVLLRLAAAPS